MTCAYSPLTLSRGDPHQEATQSHTTTPLAAGIQIQPFRCNATRNPRRQHFFLPGGCQNNSCLSSIRPVLHISPVLVGLLCSPTIAKEGKKSTCMRVNKDAILSMDLKQLPSSVVEDNPQVVPAMLAKAGAATARKPSLVLPKTSPWLPLLHDAPSIPHSSTTAIHAPSGKPSPCTHVVPWRYLPTGGAVCIESIAQSLWLVDRAGQPHLPARYLSAAAIPNPKTTVI